MYSLQLSLIIFLTLVFKNKVQCCEFTFSLKNKEIALHYLAYDSPDEFGGCITPQSTVTENRYAGNVDRITLNNVKVTTLKNKTIANFLSTTEIRMQGNTITTIKTNAFSNLPGLTILDLSDNKIKLVEENILSGIPQLRTLTLKGNKLPNFKREWLGNIPRLEYLNLSYNSIESIPSGAFTNLSRLLTIDMSHNHIRDVEGNAFEGIPSLAYLDLSYNKLQRFEDNTFTPLTGLSVLNLYNNNVSYVSAKVLESLSLTKELIMWFNPFSCECHEKIIEWANSKGVRVKPKELLCNKASDLERIPVCVLTDDKNCNANPTEDLYSLLHSGQPDYECYLKHEPYLQ